MVYGESNLNDDEGLELWGLEWAAARERERETMRTSIRCVRNTYMICRAA